MLRGHPRRVGHEVLQVFAVIFAHLAEGVLPVLGLAQPLLIVRIGLLDLIAELVIQELVQEHLHDDLILATVARQPVGRARSPQRIYQRLRLYYYFLCLHIFIFFISFIIQ